MSKTPKQELTSKEQNITQHVSEKEFPLFQNK